MIDCATETGGDDIDYRSVRCIVQCDVCGGRYTFGGASQMHVEAQLRRKRWHVDGDTHVCPRHGDDLT